MTELIDDNDDSVTVDRPHRRDDLLQLFDQWPAPPDMGLCRGCRLLRGLASLVGGVVRSGTTGPGGRTFAPMAKSRGARIAHRIEARTGILRVGVTVEVQFAVDRERHRERLRIAGPLLDAPQ